MNSATQRTRVLHIIPSFGVSGAEQMAAHLMSGLKGSCDVAAIGLLPALNSPIEKRLIREGIPFWTLNKRLGFDPRMFQALYQVVKSIRPHVVHTHMSVLRYALPGLLLCRVPVVVHTLHNMAERETDAAGRVLNWFAFRGRVLPVAVSREVAATVSQVYGLECRAIVPNGIPIEQYQRNLEIRVQWRKQEGFADDAVLFTSVGRLARQKNPQLLVRAFAELNDPRAHLVMLGEGPLRDQLIGYIHRRGLGGRVHLLGKREDISECLAASDTFVLSSDWEGNPLSVMEAMAGSLPVISTAVGGVPELVQNSKQGILVSPGDEAALAKAMRTLLEDTAQRSAMAHAARLRAVEAFDVDQMVRRYIAVYNDALSESARSVGLGVTLGADQNTV